MTFTLEELDGVPEDDIAGLPKITEGDTVLYEVDNKGHDMFTIVSSPALQKVSTHVTTVSNYV